MESIIITVYLNVKAIEYRMSKKFDKTIEKRLSKNTNITFSRGLGLDISNALEIIQYKVMDNLYESLWISD